MEQTALLVDDDLTSIEVLKKCVRLVGLRPLVARDGLEGLKLARNEKPTIIILDVLLPKMDGYKLSRLIKFDERYRDIPIIMVTSKSDPKDEKTGLSTGADAYVTKPFEVKELVKTIQNVLS